MSALQHRGQSVAAVWELCRLVHPPGGRRIAVFVLALAVAGIGALPRATASPVAAFGAVSVTAGASAVVESDSIRIPGPGVTATLPVLEIRGEVQRLILPTANLDGSLTDLDGRRFRLDADLLFRFDSADLTPAADAAIGELSGKLRAAGATRVLVDGYTDSVGEAAYNLTLSRQRAAAVADRLRAALGTGARLTVRGHGEEDPVASNDDARGQALNRRVTVTVER